MSVMRLDDPTNRVICIDPSTLSNIFNLINIYRPPGGKEGCFRPKVILIESWSIVFSLIMVDYQNIENFVSFI
jgi:hypothetical protein